VEFSTPETRGAKALAVGMPVKAFVPIVVMTLFLFFLAGAWLTAGMNEYQFEWRS